MLWTTSKRLLAHMSHSSYNKYSFLNSYFLSTIGTCKIATTSHWTSYDFVHATQCCVTWSSPLANEGIRISAECGGKQVSVAGKCECGRKIWVWWGKFDCAMSERECGEVKCVVLSVTVPYLGNPRSSVGVHPEEPLMLCQLDLVYGH